MSAVSLYQYMNPKVIMVKDREASKRYVKSLDSMRTYYEAKLSEKVTEREVIKYKYVRIGSERKKDSAAIVNMADVLDLDSVIWAGIGQR